MTQQRLPIHQSNDQVTYSADKALRIAQLIQLKDMLLSRLKLLVGSLVPALGNAAVETKIEKILGITFDLHKLLPEVWHSVDSYLFECTLDMRLFDIEALKKLYAQSLEETERTCAT